MSPQPIAERHRSGPSADSGRLDILLIEDSTSDAALTAELVATEFSDATIIVASSIADACAHLRRQQFGCVLLDLTLPDATGLDGLTTLLPLCPEIPVVVLTGRVDPALGIAAVEAGAQDYLTKDGLQAAGLGRVVRHSVGRHRHRLAHRAAFVRAPIGMALVRPDGTVQEVNDALALLLELPAQTLTGLQFIELVDYDDRATTGEAVALVSAGLAARVNREARLHGRNGTITWCRLAVAAGGEGMAIIQVEDVSDQHAATSALIRQAMHDPLTGLPNRLLLETHLSDVSLDDNGEPSTIALLFIDLDGFKQINDNYGHHVGDQLLQCLAERSATVLRPQEQIFRLGGDEFVVLARGLPDPKSAVAVAERLRTALSEPVELEGQEIRPAASIGVAFSIDGHLPSDDLLRYADSAMYRAKQTGKGKVTYLGTQP